MEGHLVQPKYSGEDLSPVSRDVPDFVDSTWEKGQGVEEGREGELDLMCKIKRLYEKIFKIPKFHSFRLSLENKT